MANHTNSTLNAIESLTQAAEHELDNDKLNSAHSLLVQACMQFELLNDTNGGSGPEYDRIDAYYNEIADMYELRHATPVEFRVTKFAGEQADRDQYSEFYRTESEGN